MPFIASFYASGETTKNLTDRTYHNNSACRTGQAIGTSDRRPSTGGHRLCADCGKLNMQESSKRW